MKVFLKKKSLTETSHKILKTVCIFSRANLVMQVRDLTDAPPPQVREHTDQPLHVAHSFLKCSCLRVRAGRTDESSLLGPHAEIQEGWKKSIKQRDNYKDNFKNR